jgi:hypothetical protein
MADHAYVTFLDILGYKETLEKDAKEGTQAFRSKMTSAFRCFEDINHAVHKYQAISDSIFLSCSDREAIRQLLCDIRNVVVGFLRQGLLMRGGMTFGQHFQNMSMTYSPALTKAYLLESKVAEYPRVMVDQNIITMFPELEGSGDVLRSGANWFINIADKDSLPEIWKLAELCYFMNLDAIILHERVRSKHHWFQNYLIELHAIYGLETPTPYLKCFDSVGENVPRVENLTQEQVLSNMISH